MKLSKPRTKFYSCGIVYWQFLRDLLARSIHRGDDLTKFEAAAAEHFGSDHAVAVPMARVGIYLCLRYYLQAGQLVASSPYTLAEVINMIVCAGGTPRFVDIDRNNADLDPEKLSQCTDDNLGAILVTHLHGIPANIRPILEFAKSRGIPVIEDAAQSAGAMVDGRYVGTLGNAGVFSFGILKQLNSIYGGMVLTNDAALTAFLREELAKFAPVSVGTLADKLAYLGRNHVLTSNPIFTLGTFPLLRHGALHDVDWINRLVTVETDLRLKHEIDDWYQHQLSASQARMLLRQLPDLEKHDQQRIRHGQAYLELLSDVPGLVLPRLPENCRATFAHFPVQVADPPNLLRWLNFYGQDVVIQHFANCAELDCFSKFRRDCPVAAEVANSMVLLPTYPDFGIHNVQRNSQIVRKYFGAGQPIFDGTNCLQLG